RYGGVEPAEALKMVTLNPAIQLGLGDRIGSLEVGKDADFVLWSGSPLSTRSLCEETWIEGRRYFSRAADLAARPALAAERQALTAKVRALANKPKAGGGEKSPGGSE
ncbi:MAG: amidohydrolase family protein, partial [Acidobacteria bacterium]|nr:amidohydrolase family protein [Acidobacteriota bacterium]